MIKKKHQMRILIETVLNAESSVYTKDPLIDRVAWTPEIKQKLLAR
jgi:hypothetical protein